MKDITTADEIRRRNRVKVLESLILDGPSTRQQLATKCNLSTASSSNMIQDLLAGGLVRESGLQHSGGRPSSIVEVVADAAFFIGADVGETDVRIALFDLALTPRDVVRIEAESRTASPSLIAEEIDRGLNALEARNPEAWSLLRGIGLAVPGVVDTRRSEGAVLYAQSVGWDPIPVSSLCHREGVPVMADNGAKAFARAELRVGSLSGDPDAESSVVVILGRGLGMGILVGGRVLLGLTSSAGEFGHTKLLLDGPTCHCGARGCLEAFVGADATAARWAEASGREAMIAREAIEDLVAASEAGDSGAARVLDETIGYLALGLSNVVNLLNPGRCVLGGWLGTALMDARANELESRTRQLALQHPAEGVRVTASRLGEEAIALGGALLALEACMDSLAQSESPAA